MEFKIDETGQKREDNKLVAGVVSSDLFKLANTISNNYGCGDLRPELVLPSFDNYDVLNPLVKGNSFRKSGRYIVEFTHNVRSKNSEFTFNNVANPSDSYKVSVVGETGRVTYHQNHDGLQGFMLHFKNLDLFNDDVKIYSVLSASGRKKVPSKNVRVYN